MIYYIMYQGNVTGPMTKEQVKAYNVTQDTMVSANGGDWRPLYTYPELMEERCNSGVSLVRFQRQLSFSEAINICFKKYACFHGRASRSEYWWWTLFQIIISMGINIVTFDPSPSDLDQYLLENPWTCLISIALFLPSLGVSVRRLHDIGKSGWWLLLNLFCCIGSIILLVWNCRESDTYTNEYGDQPYISYR